MVTPWHVAVDIGNARIKFGLFGPPEGTVPIFTPAKRGLSPLPQCGEQPANVLLEPEQTLSLDSSADFSPLASWLDATGVMRVSWWIGSVCRPTTTRLVDWLRAHRPDDSATLLSAADLPLVVKLDRPDMVGIDRLIDAVAANCLRAAGRPAVVIDVGTAITVDAVSADGAFLGGAILPGVAMSARAMHEFTDLLPLVDDAELAAPPPALGTSTRSAMQSGLFWGAVGAIRELVAQLGREFPAVPQVFLTGGAGATVADLLGPDARYVPHLTLAGIAICAARGGRRGSGLGIRG